MKILHVITSLEIGGAENLVTELLPRFKQLGIDAELAIFNGTRTPLYHRLEKNGIRIHSLTRGSSNVYNPANIFRLHKIIRAGHYDIVHTHNTAPQYFAALCQGISPHPILITTEHNTDNRRRHFALFRPLDRWMYRHYNRIICISNKAKDNLDSYLGRADRSVLVLNGVDTNRYANPIKNISASDPVTLTMIAGMRLQKDQDTIIRALTHLPDNVRLCLVGDGPRREALQNLAHECGVATRVDFAGVQFDIPARLKQADILIMSSHFEGLSLSSVESMASGRPLIASDVDGLSEVVSGAGLLFPHSDDKALAEAIMSLIDDPQKYHDVARACQQRAASYSIDRTVAGYIDIYHSLTHHS